MGTAKLNGGDSSGLGDLERAMEIAAAAGSSEVARAANNLAVSFWTLGDLRHAIVLLDDAIAHAERVGWSNLVRFSRNVKHFLMLRAGGWTVLPHIEEFLAQVEAGEPHYHEGGMRLNRALVRLARDDVDGALDDVRKAIRLARRAGDPQQRVPWLCIATRLLVEAGELGEARQLVPEALQAVGAVASWAFVELALAAQKVGFTEDVAELVRNGPQTKWAEATQALVQDDFVLGADLLGEIGDEELEALARIRAAEQFAAAGRRAEADEQLRLSLSFWQRAGAPRYIRKAEALLAAAS
jgi:tetratricopeptide (TPR) repeat protein